MNGAARSFVAKTKAVQSHDYFKENPLKRRIILMFRGDRKAKD